MLEQMQEEINGLKIEIKELRDLIRIMRDTHSYDMGRVFEQIDKINKEGE